MKGQRGLVQGLASSSLVAEMVLADVLNRAADPLGQFTTLITYSDNVGGLISSETDEEALATALKRVFQTHPAGPLHLKIDGPRDISLPSKFLGYWFVRADDGARAFLPDYVWELKEQELMTRFADAVSMQDMLAVCRQVQSYCAAYHLAAETNLLVQRLCAFMREELAYRERLRSIQVFTQP